MLPVPREAACCNTNGICEVAIAGVIAVEDMLTLGCSSRDCGKDALASKAMAAANTATEVRKAFFFIFSLGDLLTSPTSLLSSANSGILLIFVAGNIGLRYT